jgi:signal transduction histidine kinase/dsRNA-specific ribonuclease
MADTDRQPSLGVLERTVGSEADIERARAVLRAFGLSEPRLELSNAVAVALTHTTYFYENQANFPNITKGLMDALFYLGIAFVKKLAAIDSYKRTAFPSAASLSKEVAEVTFALESWAASRKWLVENAALGGTFADTNAPATVYERLLRQVVGVLCLAGKETVASDLLEGLLSDVRLQRATTVADAKTTLQEAIAPSTVEYSYEREGPDHEPVFHATVIDTRGRRGTGLGRSKRQAAQNAALDFLRRHNPQALSMRTPDSAPRRPLVAIPEPYAHVAAVRRLQKLFGLPTSAMPLLSQALIHTSWAYEHSFEMARYNQQDNQVLAFVGAQAAGYEDALAATRQAAADPPQAFAFRGLPNDGYNSLFHRTDLVSGLLLGAGQASKISEEMGATAFQAIIGAVFVATGFADNLAACWPQAWAPMWQTIASPIPRTSDPTTLLQEAASAMRLQTEYEFRRSGPEHASPFQATLVLTSESLRIRTRVTGSPVVRKVQARHEVSAEVLRTLDLLAQPTLGRELAKARADEVTLARFLLAHQAALLATSPVPLQRWTVARFFGLHLADVPDQLIAWADGADRILDSRNTIEAGARFEEVFRVVLEPVSTLREHLARTLETLEHISAPEDLTREHLDQLVQLCGVYRCVGAEDPDVGLPELADDWNFLYRGRLAAPTMPAVRLTGRERAILDAAITAVLLPGVTATVEVTSTRPLRVRIATATGPAPQASTIAETCDMWSGVTNTTVLSPLEHGIEVTISTTESPAEPGPITAAVLAALRPRPEPYQASVADILHDLKNQAVAARHAVTQPTETETARLEQQLDARRHLDRAHTMILQLRAATSLLEPARDENVSVELGAFLRNYGRAAFSWLPDNIAVSTPGASHPAHVAIDARRLTAILDNLVKNAAEAMPNGGSIKLGWAADKYEAIVEVADDGPGLPAGIAQAFAIGHQLHSTKPGGNGLGLLSAKSLVRRVGGQLAAVSVTSGTAWEITLPIVAQTLGDP